MTFSFGFGFDLWQWRIEISPWGWRRGIRWRFGLVQSELWAGSENYGFRTEYWNPRRPTYESEYDCVCCVFGIQKNGYREGDDNYWLRHGERVSVLGLSEFPAEHGSGAAPSGVEGAHEGTTADKSGWCECGHAEEDHSAAGCAVSDQFPDSGCECNKFKEVALAESSLSSPPPTLSQANSGSLVTRDVVSGGLDTIKPLLKLMAAEISPKCVAVGKDGITIKWEDSFAQTTISIDEDGVSFQQWAPKSQYKSTAYFEASWASSPELLPTQLPKGDL